MTMHNPAHPGELLLGWLDDLGLTVTAFALHIGISRVMLSRVLHGLLPCRLIWTCVCPKHWAPHRATGWHCKPSVTCGPPVRLQRKESESNAWPHLH